MIPELGHFALIVALLIALDGKFRHGVGMQPVLTIDAVKP